MLQPAHFTVQTVDAGVGEVLVYIEDPEGHTEEVWRGHWGSDKSTDQQRNGLEMAAGGTLQRWRRGRPHHRGCRRRGVRRSSDADRFPSRRPRWFPTMTRTAPTLSPTCPRSPACTRYPPVGPPMSSPLHSHPCIWLNGPLSQLTPRPTPMHQPHPPATPLGSAPPLNPPLRAAFF